jgi:hypothetical protein
VIFAHQLFLHAGQVTMTNDRDKRERQTGMLAKNAEKALKDPRKDPAKDPRKDRLKLALRENLKRRKSQARGRGDVTTASSKGDDAPPHDEGGKKPNG